MLRSTCKAGGVCKLNVSYSANMGVLTVGLRGAAGAALPMPSLEELLDAQVFKEGAQGLYFAA